MNEAKQLQIQTLEHKINEWNKFKTELLNEDDDVIIAHGNKGARIGWAFGELIYSSDISLFSTADQIVAKKAKIIPQFDYSIPNYTLRMGKDNCIRYIEAEIFSLTTTVKHLKSE